MNNTHVKLDYINGSVKVSALSSEAKKLYRDKDQREHLYTKIETIINKYLVNKQ